MEVQKGFVMVGFSESIVDTIWKAIATVLLLGNIEFIDSNSE